MSVAQELAEQYVAGKIMGKMQLGYEISDIINQYEDDKTDGKVIDEIVELLRRYKIYKERE